MPIYFPPTLEASQAFLAEAGDDTPPGTAVITPDAGDMLHVWRDDGLFERINRRMGVHIGEYEEQSIPAERMPELLAVIQQWMRDQEGSTVLMPLAQRLAGACEAAIARGTDCSFVF